MLPNSFWLLLSSCLLVEANLGQGLNNNGANLGSGYGNSGYNNRDGAGLGQGYSPNNNQGYPGLGQGDNGYQGGYAGLGKPSEYTQDASGARVDTYGKNEYGNPTYNNYGRDQTTGLSSNPLGNQQGRNDYGRTQYSAPTNNNYGYDQSTGLSSVPLNDQQGRYRSQQKRSPNLGQGVQQQSLGQGVNGLGQQPGLGGQNGLGQRAQPINGLGQGVQPSSGGLGQGLSQTPSLTQGDGLENAGASQDGSLSGSLRRKRYSERGSYRKTCNTYFGKYICYRLYEDGAEIPNDFTCWKTYLGKRNCTETENVLYLDRRNVEVDPSEQLDRQYYPSTDSDRHRVSDSSRDRHRQRDDEFGAIEKNLHNQRNSEHTLPGDNYRREESRTRIYADDRELRNN